MILARAEARIYDAFGVKERKGLETGMLGALWWVPFQIHILAWASRVGQSIGAGRET